MTDICVAIRAQLCVCPSINMEFYDERECGKKKLGASLESCKKQ